MTATAVITQLASIEASLGLKEGTLHHPGALGGRRDGALLIAACAGGDAASGACWQLRRRPLPACCPTSLPPRTLQSAVPLAADAAATSDVLTLTGWAALAGVLALAVVLLAVAVACARRVCGLCGSGGGGSPGKPSRRGYTRVELTQQGADGDRPGASPGRLPRRHVV